MVDIAGDTGGGVGIPGVEGFCRYMLDGGPEREVPDSVRVDSAWADCVLSRLLVSGIGDVGRDDCFSAERRTVGGGP